MSYSILLVDDSRSARIRIKKDFKALFGNSEIILTEASNGKEALDLCLNNEYNLIFLDLTMPVMTGYEMLEALKEKGVELNIIVLTADIQPGAEKAVKRLGAKGYMKKPFVIEEAKRLIEEMQIIEIS